MRVLLLRREHFPTIPDPQSHGSSEGSDTGESKEKRPLAPSKDPYLGSVIPAT